MTIEEMEAEIQETNEAIRKRRRRGLGLIPVVYMHNNNNRNEYC
jgi:hypothetical protein